MVVICDNIQKQYLNSILAKLVYTKMLKFQKFDCYLKLHWPMIIASVIYSFLIFGTPMAFNAFNFIWPFPKISKIVKLFPLNCH